MSTLTVYDAQGNEYSPSGGATGTNQRIKEMALASMRVAIKPDSRQVTGYFRAKETPNSRAEQFYGEYTDRSTAEPLADFVNAVRTQIDEWNHTLDESDDSMAVFNALANQRRTTTPGGEKDLRILEELAGDREVTAVGVSGANEAIGLLQEFADQHSVAIADSTNTDALSEFDIVIVTGRHQGIEPIGQTTGRWKEAKQSLKRELVDEEISAITESVRTLKRDFGLSSDEIQRKVSGLEPSSSGGRGSSQLGGSASTGEKLKQTLLSPQVGKYLFIGSIVLILLIGGAVLFGGGIPFVGSGSSNTVSGTVYGDSGPAANQTVELTNQSNNVQLSTSTDSNGKFEFNTSGFNGPYTVSVDGYNSKEVADGDTDVKFGESPGLLSGLPIIGSGDNTAEGDGDNQNENDGSNPENSSSGDGTDGSQSTTEESQSISYVEGSVVREEDGQDVPVASAIVTLEDSKQNVISAESNETTQEGAYRIDDIEMNSFEGDIESDQIYIIAEKEDDFRAKESIDLSIRDQPYEIGPQTVRVTEEDQI